MKINYRALVTPQSATIFNSTKRLVAHSAHPMFEKIVEGIKKGVEFDKLAKLFEFKQRIEKGFNVQIKNGNQVYYKGKRVNNVMTKKIIGAIRDNVPYKPFVRFMDNLMQNPSERCREQLFSYLENYGLAIDSNGWVYGYKAVNKDLKSKWDEKTQYVIGGTLKVDRKKCADSDTVACGFGLHIGDISYVLGYGNDSTDRFLLLKFNPKNCLSCPTDSDWKKLRLCSVNVVKEVKREEMKPLNNSYLGKLKNKAIKLVKKLTGRG